MSRSQDQDGESGIAVQKEVKTKLPRRYKVLLHNDDYTTMEFVVLVLRQVFRKSFEDAEMLMIKVHKEGLAVCGVYTYEIAEAKVAKVTELARQNDHPLKCSFEPE